MTDPRRLLAVHAHPDDECLSTGGILARYAKEGAHVCLVTCTNGELGEIAVVPGLGGPEELRGRLAEVREAELRRACAILGVADLRLLRYHDSGMAGTHGNQAPNAFVNVDTTEVAERIAAILREVRPQVVVTYNEYGFYGHPDHIKAHEATLEAIAIASDADALEEFGPPHQISKLYYTAVPKSRLRRARDIFGEENTWTTEEIERIGTDDEEVTTEIDVASFVHLKFEALEAHRTQRGTTERFLSLPAEAREIAMGTEHFVLRGPQAPPETMETDLFQGVW